MIGDAVKESMKEQDESAKSNGAKAIAPADETRVQSSAKTEAIIRSIGGK